MGLLEITEWYKLGHLQSCKYFSRPSYLNQLNTESTGASSPPAFTSWPPRPRASPEGWRRSICLVTCSRRAGWTSCWRLMLSTRNRWTTPCCQRAPTSALTRTTITSTTRGWRIWASTQRRGQRSPGGGTTSSCWETPHQHGCSNTIRGDYLFL